MLLLRSFGGVILTGETEEFGEEPVPVALCPIKILHELSWD